MEDIYLIEEARRRLFACHPFDTQAHRLPLRKIPSPLLVYEGADDRIKPRLFEGQRNRLKLDRVERIE